MNNDIENLRPHLFQFRLYDLKNLDEFCSTTGLSEPDKFAVAGGVLSKRFDVENKRFIMVSCPNYDYTEMYKTSTSRLENLFDLFMSW